MASRHRSKKRARMSSAASTDIEDQAVFQSREASQIRRGLLAWYDAEHRSLPWRRNQHSLHQLKGDPDRDALFELPPQQFIYRVWISEVMSQQTQVSRAAGYYKRWIARWPTLQALAKADMDEVNEVWAGLGYYTRAKRLLEGAQHISDKLDGKIPTTTEELQRIPGVGAYTGNAVASIAAGQAVAAVDANVVRVLSRLRCLGGDPKSKAAGLLHAELAASILDPERPGDFNQAMMELGATVCSSAKPACEACPLQGQCRAYAQLQAYLTAGGKIMSLDAPLVTAYPRKVDKTERKAHCRAVCVVKLLVPPSRVYPTPETLFLLVKRSEKGWLAGLWEFPGMETEPGIDGLERSTALDKYLRQGLGLDFPRGAALRVRERKYLGEVQHEFSHIRMTLRVELLTLQGDVPAFFTSEHQPAKARPIMRWVEQEALAKEGLSSRERKIWNLMGL